MSKTAADKLQSIGVLTENLALKWLEEKGLSLITRNYRCKTGEIDLIMSDHSCLIFVEVRYRRNSTFGSALESVNRQKQKKLLRTAQVFLTKHPRYRGLPCRFDVMAAQPANNNLQWTWIKDAFGMQA